ncbi:MAG: hypothetical protein ISS70_07540 [Phycisphaerae bacterium]|nr:hypothetical protein [Phycisphaerae bacterium]
MRINVLFLATTVGVLGLAQIAAGEQADETAAGRLGSMGGPTDDPGAAWGLHEPLKDCVGCHGDQPQQSSPDKSDLVAAVPKLCYTCHEEYTSLDAWEHGPVATGDCLVCHEPHKTKNESLLTKPMPELCYHCHEAQTLELVANHSEESHTSCTDCHESHSSPGRMLLKQSFLKTDAGRDYLANNSVARPRPTFVDRRGSLGGLEGVAVVSVVDGSDLARRYGVTEDLVRAKVERQLRQNGIRILPRKEQTARESALYVHLRLVEVPSQRRPGQVDALSGSFNISLRQTVELLAAPGDGKRRFCAATTWDTGAVVIWGVSQIEEGIDQAVKVLVGRFGNDYVKANPRDKTLALLPTPGGPATWFNNPADSRRTSSFSAWSFHK